MPNPCQISERILLETNSIQQITQPGKLAEGRNSVNSYLSGDGAVDL